jgi:hypothetical protein
MRIANKKDRNPAMATARTFPDRRMGEDNEIPLF